MGNGRVKSQAKAVEEAGMADELRRAGEEMRRALVRGFTRSDLLLLGELCDVSHMAGRLGFRVPVAVSRSVQDASHALARTLGIPPVHVTSRLLRHLADVVSTTGWIDGTAGETFTVPGMPFDLSIHVGREDSVGDVVTVYAASESPALV